MELACIENLDMEIAMAPRDRNIFDDNRVLVNLINNEMKYKPKFNYFLKMQTELQPYMRQVVATWMMELCEEQMLEEQVFPLAINLMDRFLSVCDIQKQQLQLLGAACLLIASKLRTSNILSIALLRVYTDYSVSHDHIEKWETLVMSKLEWDVNGITAFDFIDHVIQRCPWGANNDLVRKHAQTLVSICALESRFMEVLPSIVAAACICCAVKGLKLPCAEKAVEDICKMLGTTRVQMDIVGFILETQVVKFSALTKDIDQESCVTKYVELQKNAKYDIAS